MMGVMISTVDDLLVYGRALATGEGLLPLEQQAVQQLSVIPSPKQLEKDTGDDPEKYSFVLVPSRHTRGPPVPLPASGTVPIRPSGSELQNG